MIFTSIPSGLDYPCTTAQGKGWLILPPLTINLTTELWLFKVQFLYQLLFPAVAHVLLAFPKDKEQLLPMQGQVELAAAEKLSHPARGFIVQWFVSADSKE